MLGAGKAVEDTVFECFGVDRVIVKDGVPAFPRAALSFFFLRTFDSKKKPTADSPKSFWRRGTEIQRPGFFRDLL
jgi:hypothetical protein